MEKLLKNNKVEETSGKQRNCPKKKEVLAQENVRLKGQLDDVTH